MENRFAKVALSDLCYVARKLIKLHLKENKVVVLNGEMGAGKTTFIKSICEELGSADEISSPTFSILNEYLISPRGKVYHFDCYRMDSELEALDIGFEDYLYSGNYCFIEWPSQVVNLLPEQFLEIEIIVKDDSLREIVFRKHDQRSV